MPEPRTQAEFEAALRARPELVERVAAGDADAFVEYLEMAPGARVQGGVEGVVTRELAV